MLKDFWEGFVQGAKETPRGFFAPLIAFCCLLKFIVLKMVAITDAEIARGRHR